MSTLDAMSEREARRVLVVDDDMAVRDALEVVLRALGYAVDLVSSGAAALARLEQEPYDVVITDLLMPGMSGWVVLEEVRRRHPRVPVVVITGAPLSLTDARLRQPGVALVHKPVEQRVLEEALARVFADLA